MQEVGYAFQRGDLGVLPETGVLGGDAAVGKDAGGFDNSQRCTPVCKGSQVDEVKICQMAIVCRVHAHWRDPDSILKGNISDFERREKRWWVLREC